MPCQGVAETSGAEGGFGPKAAPPPTSDAKHKVPISGLTRASDQMDTTHSKFPQETSWIQLIPFIGAIHTPRGHLPVSLLAIQNITEDTGEKMYGRIQVYESPLLRDREPPPEWDFFFLFRTAKTNSKLKLSSSSTS